MSQTQLILDFLADGEWHTVAEIHAACGFSRLNSRISDLRARGWVVECEHIRGAGTGSRAYKYRLVLVETPESFERGVAAFASEERLFPVAPGAYDR